MFADKQEQQKPVLDSNSTGTKAILQEGKLGYLFTPGEEGDFCSRLEALMEDANLLGKQKLEEKKW